MQYITNPENKEADYTIRFRSFFSLRPIPSSRTVGGHRSSGAERARTRHVIALLAVGILLLTSAASCDDSTSRIPSTLSSVREIREAADGSVALGHPVEFTAVVTYYQPEWNQLYVQDTTGALYVDPPDEVFNLKEGQRIRITGTLDTPNRGISNIELTPLEEGDVPEAPLVPMADIDEHFNEWIELNAVVRSAEVLDGMLTIELADGLNRVTARVLRTNNLRPDIVGRQIRLKGVPAP